MKEIIDTQNINHEESAGWEQNWPWLDQLHKNHPAIAEILLPQPPCSICHSHGRPTTQFTCTPGAFRFSICEVCLLLENQALEARLLQISEDASEYLEPTFQMDSDTSLFGDSDSSEKNKKHGVSVCIFCWRYGYNFRYVHMPVTTQSPLEEPILFWTTAEEIKHFNYAQLIEAFPGTKVPHPPERYKLYDLRIQGICDHCKTQLKELIEYRTPDKNTLPNMEALQTMQLIRYTQYAWEEENHSRQYAHGAVEHSSIFYWQKIEKERPWLPVYRELLQDHGVFHYTFWKFPELMNEEKFLKELRALANSNPCAVVETITQEFPNNSCEKEILTLFNHIRQLNTLIQWITFQFQDGRNAGIIKKLDIFDKEIHQQANKYPELHQVKKFYHIIKPFLIFLGPSTTGKGRGKRAHWCHSAIKSKEFREEHQHCYNLWKQILSSPDDWPHELGVDEQKTFNQALAGVVELQKRFFSRPQRKLFNLFERALTPQKLMYGYMGEIQKSLHTDNHRDEESQRKKQNFSNQKNKGSSRAQLSRLKPYEAWVEYLFRTDQTVTMGEETLKGFWKLVTSLNETGRLNHQCERWINQQESKKQEGQNILLNYWELNKQKVEQTSFTLSEFLEGTEEKIKIMMGLNTWEERKQIFSILEKLLDDNAIHPLQDLLVSQAEQSQELKDTINSKIKPLNDFWQIITDTTLDFLPKVVSQRLIFSDQSTSELYRQLALRTLFIGMIRFANQKQLRPEMEGEKATREFLRIFHMDPETSAADITPFTFLMDSQLELAAYLTAPHYRVNLKRTFKYWREKLAPALDATLPDTDLPPHQIKAYWQRYIDYWLKSRSSRILQQLPQWREVAKVFASSTPRVEIEPENKNDAPSSFETEDWNAEQNWQEGELPLLEEELNWEQDTIALPTDSEKDSVADSYVDPETPEGIMEREELQEFLKIELTRSLHQMNEDELQKLLISDQEKLSLILQQNIKHPILLSELEHQREQQESLWSSEDFKQIMSTQWQKQIQQENAVQDIFEMLASHDFLTQYLAYLTKEEINFFRFLRDRKGSLKNLVGKPLGQFEPLLGTPTPELEDLERAVAKLEQRMAEGVLKILGKSAVQQLHENLMLYFNLDEIM